MGIVSDLKGHLQVSLAAGAAYGAGDVLINKTPLSDAAAPAAIMGVSELIGSVLTTWVLPFIAEDDVKSRAQYRFYLNPLASGGLNVFASDAVGYSGGKTAANRFLMGVGSSAVANYITAPSRA